MRSTRFSFFFLRLLACWYKWATNEAREQYNISRLCKMPTPFFFSYSLFYTLCFMDALRASLRWHFFFSHFYSKNKKPNSMCTNFFLCFVFFRWQKWYPKLVQFSFPFTRRENIQGSISFWETNIEQDCLLNSLKYALFFLKMHAIQKTYTHTHTQQNTEFYERIYAKLIFRWKIRKKDIRFYQSPTISR